MPWWGWLIIYFVPVLYCWALCHVGLRDSCTRLDYQTKDDLVARLGDVRECIQSLLIQIEDRETAVGILGAISRGEEWKNTPDQEIEEQNALLESCRRQLANYIDEEIELSSRIGCIEHLVQLPS